jgi:hypothetical protein
MVTGFCARAHSARNWYGDDADIAQAGADSLKTCNILVLGTKYLGVAYPNGRAGDGGIMRSRRRPLSAFLESEGTSLKHSQGGNMPEDRVNIVDALRGQQEQLKRLIAQKMWISDAPHATLSEINAQLGELKRLLAQLESDIRDQLKKRTGTQPMRQQCPNAAAKARDFADQEIDKLSDQSATAEERQDRKRRLLRGPRGLRDMRGVSSPKTKN